MTRNVLVLAHTGRRDAVDAAITVAGSLYRAGLRPVMLEQDIQTINAVAGPQLRAADVAVAGRDVPLGRCEVGMVLGGDGSILRAAHLTRTEHLPLMGVNLGHVGFLAESESTQLDESVQWVVTQNYTVEERMTLDVQVWNAERHIGSSWALNEASIEKASRERMVELVIEIDGAPVSAFGCDGIVMSTPTGSTAYAFSAGGPVVWPEVKALVLVPISAHALFARPLVVDPDSIMAVELLQRDDEHGVLWCDGARSMELPPGSRVEVTRSAESVLLARVHQTPFSQRLVDKFNLPTTGWRGPVEATNTLPSQEEAESGVAHD